jgi:phosphotransferase system HPr (HPr) family protein
MENKKDKVLKIEREVTIRNKYGLHARPAAVFVQTANKFEAAIKLFKDKQEADAKSIMSLLSLGAESGSVVYLIAEGEDAAEAVAELIKILERDE